MDLPISTKGLYSISLGGSDHKVYILLFLFNSISLGGSDHKVYILLLLFNDSVFPLRLLTLLFVSCHSGKKAWSLRCEIFLIVPNTPKSKN